MDRRGFLKSAGAAAALTAVPAAPAAALKASAPMKFAAADPLTNALFARRLAIESIKGTFLDRAMMQRDDLIVEVDENDGPPLRQFPAALPVHRS